jgi:hypothetical protein
MDFYDIFQNFRITGVRYEADKAAIKGTGNTVDIMKLQDQVDHLSLVCQAMCELMEDMGFNKKMLAAKIQEIDLRDGKIDGKQSKQHSCKGCNRPLADRHIKCLYCGVSVKNIDLL